MKFIFQISADVFRLTFDFFVFVLDNDLEQFADKSKEGIEELESEFGTEDEKRVASQLKTKLKLTWEDAAIAGQIENEKVNILFNLIFSSLLRLIQCWLRFKVC